MFILIVKTIMFILIVKTIMRSAMVGIDRNNLGWPMLEFVCL